MAREARRVDCAYVSSCEGSSSRRGDKAQLGFDVGEGKRERRRGRGRGRGRERQRQQGQNGVNGFLQR